MDRADTGAGEHGKGRFGNHREVDGDAVALFDALSLEHVGEAAHFAVQLGIGEAARFLGGIIGFPDDRDLIAARGEMAVDAVGGDVQPAVGEPADVKIALVERPVAREFRALDPVEPPRLFEPEGAGIGERAAIEPVIAVAVEPGGFGPFGGDGVEIVGHARSFAGRHLSALVHQGQVADPRNRGFAAIVIQFATMFWWTRA